MHTLYTCIQEARAHYADIKLNEIERNRNEYPHCHNNQISFCLTFLVKKFEYDFVGQ